MPSIWMSYVGDSACAYHRCLLPAQYCHDALDAHGWTFTLGDTVTAGHAVYVFNGLPTPLALAELAKQKNRGATVVWSVDDDWLTVPEWNPAHPGEAGMASYTLARGLADFVLTSTPALAATFAAEFGDRVLCAPNLIDLSRFPKPTIREDGNGNSYIDMTEKVKVPVRVVWAGGPTHAGDLEVVTDVLDRLIAKVGRDRVNVAYFGTAPPSKLFVKYYLKGLWHQAMVPFPAYQMTLNSMDPHVYLAPLAPVPFNLSKSAIRVYEAWGLCAAPVATDHGEYACIRSGTDGRLVRTPDAWDSALHRMVTDHEFRAACGAAGRVRVEHEFDWNNAKCRAPWYRVFERLTGVTL